MESVIEFKLPALGENIEQGDLVRLMIAPGTAVSEGQAVMELETDKAVVEVPSSVSGTVKEILVKEGEIIKVGQLIFTADNNGSTATVTESPRPAEPSAKDSPKAQPEEPSSGAVANASADSRQSPASAQPESRPAAPRTRSTDTAAAAEFRLQELGENISEGDLVRLMIAPGAKVSEGQPVMELETDKAVVEVPSSVNGVVKDIRVKPGEKVKVGQVIFTLEGGAAPQTEKPKHAPVEYFSEQTAARQTFQIAIQAEGKTEEQALPPDKPQPLSPAFAMPAQLGKVAGSDHGDPVAAAPHVRRLARELGIDIHGVKGSGPGGRISEDDVKNYSKSLLASATAAPGGTSFAQPELPDFTKWGKIERVSIRGVRRKTAEHLWQAWTTIPHVTQQDHADITELEHLRARFAPKAEESGGKMTVTAIALKVCSSALKIFPQFNASIDLAKDEI